MQILRSLQMSAGMIDVSSSICNKIQSIYRIHPHDEKI